MDKIKKFIDKSNIIHNYKYDYSKINYVNNYTKITIICPKHGEFKQVPYNHIRGSGCQKCSIESSQIVDQETFIEKAKRKHKNKYDYSKVKYTGIFKNIVVICPKHGEFEQSANVHLRSSGCPRCGHESSKILLSKPEQFIEKSKKIHNNKYDYSKVKYKNSKTKVIIICPKHGEFEQTPCHHLLGHGCQKCAREQRTSKNKLTTEQFINESIKKHGNIYNYDLVEYVNNETKVKIICKKHGINYNSKISIICPKHGKFEQMASNHLAGKGCAQCPAIISSGHQEVIDFIESIYNGKIEINDRTEISPYELDIYIPEFSLAIEYNGVFYHSYDRPETPKEKNRHRDKHLLCREKGILLIQISEHEWIEKSEVIKSIISNKLGLSNRIFARKCKIIEINSKEHKQFMDTNHIYGHGRYPNISYGLTYHNDLIMVMSFNRHHKHEWEINRLASKLRCAVVGGADKLFKSFLRNHNPNEIITYADAKFGYGNVYQNLGFINVGMTNPGYGYLKNLQYYKRQQFQKYKLKTKLEQFDQNLSETQNMFNNGFRRIWDAGHYRFVWLSKSR